MENGPTMEPDEDSANVSINEVKINNNASNADVNGYVEGDAVLQFDNLPSKMSSRQLVEQLFPVNGELTITYGPVSVDDCQKIGPTKALLRMASFD